MNNLNKIISILILIFIVFLNTGCNQDKKEHKLQINEIIITIPEDFRKDEKQNETISFLSNDNLNTIEIEEIKDEKYTIENEIQKIKDIYKNKNIELTDVSIKKEIPKIDGLVGIDKDITIHIYFIENGNNKIKMTCNGSSSSSALIFRNIAKLIIVKN